MTVSQVLKRLESLGEERQLKYHRSKGAKGELFGVKTGDLRKVAKELKGDHDLGLELWETGNLDARMLAVLLLKPKQLTPAQLTKLVKGATYFWLADWVNAYLVKKHPEKEALRVKWLAAKDKQVLRSAWSLTAERVGKDPDGLDQPGLLERIDRELSASRPEVQWTMNICLAEIGIHSPKLRKRALAIGEKHGLYRDYPVSKGCTSPFAPAWIAEMVQRQG